MERPHGGDEVVSGALSLMANGIECTLPGGKLAIDKVTVQTSALPNVCA